MGRPSGVWLELDGGQGFILLRDEEGDLVKPHSGEPVPSDGGPPGLDGGRGSADARPPSPASEDTTPVVAEDDKRLRRRKKTKATDHC